MCRTLKTGVWIVAAEHLTIRTYTHTHTQTDIHKHMRTHQIQKLTEMATMAVKDANAVKRLISKSFSGREADAVCGFLWVDGWARACAYLVWGVCVCVRAWAGVPDCLLCAMLGAGGGG